MRIDRRDLGRHYASLNDEELLSLKREDLTEVAQVIYDLEIASRGLRKTPASDFAEGKVEASFKERNERNEEEYSESDWYQDEALACSFPDTQGNNAAERAAKARDALKTAGIPSQLRVVRDQDHGNEPPGYSEWKVYVPIGLAMHAASILDRDMFNEEYELQWRDHLCILSDKDLLLLDPDILCAGLLDRVDRVKKVYAEEMAKRKLKDRAS
jgi:hypothetical protein